MKSWYLPLGVVLMVSTILTVIAATQRSNTSGWTAEELDTVRSLWLGSLEPLPSDPSNRYADDPRAAALGHQLFFDTRFSANGEIACATCHIPELNFTDGLPLSKGVGAVPRKSMTITGTAYSPWFFWDGRKDSLWAQALGPLESSVEHGIDRSTVAYLVHEHYQDAYKALFGDLPNLRDADRFPIPAGPVEDPVARANWEGMALEDQEAVTRAFVNVGKAIAAYERQIMPGPSRFDRYVEALLDDDREAASTLLSEDEIAGLKLFIGKGNCIDCHNGPLFTNNDFHNTGVPARAELPDDTGRALGAQQVVDDEFNCLSSYSDAEPEDCLELRFLKTEGHEFERAFKPPTLRNVARAAPYMHAGQFSTLREVLEHYNDAPSALQGHSELRPLHLSEQELDQLVAFLKALSGPLAVEAGYLSQPRTAISSQQ